MNWPLALSTAIFLEKPMLGVLPLIRQAGFSRIDIAGSPYHFDYHDAAVVAEVKRALDSSGMRAVSLHAPYGERVDLTSPDEGGRLKAIAEVKMAAAALAKLGGETMVVHGGSDDNRVQSEGRERLQLGIQSLSELAGYCRELGLKMALENMLAHLVGGREGELEWVLNQLPDDNVGVCIDTGHAFLTGNLLEAVKKFGPRLLIVHAHDNRGTRDDHLPPGEGVIPWVDFLNALSAVRFGGHILLEVLGGGWSSSLLERVRDSVRMLKTITEGKTYQILK